jgi:CBS domain-containing protein
MLAKDVMLPTTEVVHLDQSLLEAGIRLRRYRLPALPVVDGDEIVGLLTAEALEKQAAAPDNDLAETAVRDHMSAEVAFCRTDESVAAARRLIEEGGHSHLLVTDGKGRLCGLIAAHDLGAEAAGEAESEDPHVVKTPGRATGSRLHQPPGFSVKPVIKQPR